jgi:hypothetical protein
VLVKFDADEAAGAGCSSILFPLLGLGTAKGDRATIRDLITAAAQYLSQHAETRVKRLVFIARYYEDLAACRAVADSCDLLESAGGSADSLPGPAES